MRRPRSPPGSLLPAKLGCPPFTQPGQRGSMQMVFRFHRLLHRLRPSLSMPLANRMPPCKRPIHSRCRPSLERLEERTTPTTTISFAANLLTLHVTAPNEITTLSVSGTIFSITAVDHYIRPEALQPKKTENRITCWFVAQCVETLQFHP